jgi:hypothetical protein
VTWKLFIDDDRDPHVTVDDAAWRRNAGLPDLPPEACSALGEWVVARTVAEAIDRIRERGVPAFVSFDHDLGPGTETGMDLAKAIVEMDLDDPCIPDGFAFEVHSANPVGRRNILHLLDNYLGFRAAEARPR